MPATHVESHSRNSGTSPGDSGYVRQFAHSVNRRAMRWKRPIVCVLVLGLAGCLIWFRKDIKYRFVVKRWGTVVPQQIYRSGQISQWLIADQLQKYNIATIVDMTAFDQHNPDHVAEVAAAQRLGVEVKRFKLFGDGTGDVANYVAALEAIMKCQQAEEPVLVHCHGGSERTGGVVFCYRTLFQGWDSGVARREMMTYGWNSGGNSPLIDYLDRHMPELCRRLVERGVLASVPRQLPSLRL